MHCRFDFLDDAIREVTKTGDFTRPAFQLDRSPGQFGVGLSGSCAKKQRRGSFAGENSEFSY
jgi:hypothetical protein